MSEERPEQRPIAASEELERVQIDFSEGPGVFLTRGVSVVDCGVCSSSLIHVSLAVRHEWRSRIVCVCVCVYSVYTPLHMFILLII